MAGSEELGLREDTLRVLAAFHRHGEAAGSPVPTPPRSPAQEEPTDFLSRLRRCLPCSLGVEHVHSFTPWIQAHGGWEGILAVSPGDLNLPLD
ncbi:BCL2L12 isoform 12 [Pongo abelii]|uniref:BCL2 like 12 n=1 Tax=Pongo abelii TaxID=9601 RepID=A0A2J8U8C2_PONAB|nr:BCL2L12 isoform 12 [Pongo abelii]